MVVFCLIMVGVVSILIYGLVVFCGYMFWWIELWYLFLFWIVVLSGSIVVL